MSIFRQNYERLVQQIQRTNGHLSKDDIMRRAWVEPFSSPRVLLSYGFCVEYEKMNRHRHDPRVRLSERIYKYF
jgi:hypothetical protein